MNHRYYSSADLRWEKETASRTREHCEFASFVDADLPEGHQKYRPFFFTIDLARCTDAYDDDTHHTAGAASIVMARVV